MKKYKLISKGQALEDVGGGVSLNDVAQAIFNGEESWEECVKNGDPKYWNEYNDSWQQYFPIDIVNVIEYEDGTHDSINLEGKPPVEIAVEGDRGYSDGPFFQRAKSFDIGGVWEYHFELESGEFNPKYLSVIYFDEIPGPLIESYEYYDPESDEFRENIEGERKSDSYPKGTDIFLYVSTSKGYTSIDLNDIKDEMKKVGFDWTEASQEEILECIENKLLDEDSYWKSVQVL